MQLPLFPLESSWVPVQPGDLPSWSGVQRIGLDIETRDPQLLKLGPGVRRGGYIVGVSFAIEDGPAYYLPIRHGGGDNLDASQVMKYLHDQAGEYTGTIVGTNLNYDLDYLAEVGVTFPRIAGQRDVQLADPLINELHDHYNLDAISKRWGFEGKNLDLLNKAVSDYGLNKKKPRSELWKLPARYVAEYGIDDAVLPLKVLRRQERVIDDEDLWQVYNLESQVQPVLLKLTRRGLRIDQDALDRIEAWALAEEQAQLTEIERLTGRKLGIGDINKKEVLVPLLKQIGMTLSYTPTGQPQIDKEALTFDHPVADFVNRARKVNKLRTTFVASIRNHMTNGRIHCTYNQVRHNREGGEAVGARYGRLSCENPNMQQQPARDDFADMWRAIYVPDEGKLWMSADYSQQEPRILTHFAEKLELPGAYNMAEQYRRNPKTDNHTWLTRLIHPETATWDEKSPEFKAKRFPCKQTFLGICYGMGGAKLARDLGLPTEWKVMPSGKRVEIAGREAQQLANLFDQHAPYVRLLAARMEESARQWGYILTLSGRRCRFPTKPGTSEYDWCHKALNRLIQGSAGDQTKMAMVAADQVGFNIQLQVHDELDGSVESKEQAMELARVMQECCPLSIPSRVDVDLGPSWGEAKEVA